MGGSKKMDIANRSEEIDVQKYWLILKRRWIPATTIFSATLVLTAVFVLFQKPAYRAEGRLLFTANNTSSLTGLGEGLGQLEAVGLQNNPADTQAEVIQSIPVVQEAIELLNLRDDEGKLLQADDVLTRLKVTGIAGTDVLQLSFEAGDPQIAAAVVNKIADIYIRNDIQTNRAKAAAAREFIQQQLPKTEVAVRSADSALRQFREKHGIVVLTEEASASVKMIADLDSSIAEAQAELADVTARSKDLQSRVGSDSREATTLSAVSQSSAVQEVLTQLQQTQQQLAVEQTRYRSGHPTITSLERRIDALNDLLGQRVAEAADGSRAVSSNDLQPGELRQSLIEEFVQAEVERQGLTNRINLLLQTQASYRERAKGIPSLEQNQRELERRVQAAQATYENLLTRLGEIQVAENQTIGTARLISPALVPTTAISPRRQVLFLLGGILGLLLGVATAFVLDLLDRSVKTLREARELFGYTLLGVIPSVPRGTTSFSLSGSDLDPSIPRVIFRELPRSSVTEAYQMLQANLKFLGSEQPARSIVITSSVEREGKSEVAANLAVALAQVGHRVLLVDADLRHPVQHHVWRLNNLVGLSNLIIDQVDPQDATVEMMPNLSVLSAGAIPPSPMALLDSKRMAALVENFSRMFDYVLFDTPPLAGRADAAILGKMADGVLLVVRPGVVMSDSAMAAKEFLTQSNQRVLGVVINDVNLKNEPDSYFYYTGTEESLPRNNVVEQVSLPYSSRRN
jgi:polysaccharide biosynthesis transport protein